MRFKILVVVLLLSRVVPVGAQDLAVEGLRVDGQVVDAEQRPVVGAKVNLRPWLGPYERSMALLRSGEPWGESIDHGVTDDGGRYRLVAPEWGLYQVIVEADGFAPAEYRVRPLLYGRTLPTLMLQASQEKWIEVRDARGEPAVGARVILEFHRGHWDLRDRVRGWGPAYRMARVEEDGVASVPYLEDEALGIGISHAGHTPWMGGLNAEGVHCGRDIELEAATAPRTVQVRQNRQPLAEALLVRSFMPLAAADRQGRVEVTFAGSSKPWVLTADGRSTRERLGSTQSRLSLTSPRWIEGEVVDAETGRGVSDALVWSDNDGFAVRTNAAGRFRWPEDFRTESLSAAHPGYASVTSGRFGLRHLFEETEDGLRFTLMPDQRVRGRVVDTRGQGLEGVAVELRGWQNRTWGTGPLERTLTGPSGEFWLSGPVQWDVFQVQASAPGKTMVRRRVSFRSLLESKGGGEESGIELVLEPGPTLTGRVLDDASRPLEGVQVDLFSTSRADSWAFGEPDGRSAPSTSTDGDGRFEVGNILNGRHSLILRAEGFAPYIRRPIPIGVAKGIRHFGDVVLEKEASLDLLVVDGDGRPVADAEISLQVLESHRAGRVLVPKGLRDILRRDGATGAEGRLRFDGLRPDPAMSLEVRHPQFASRQLEVTPSADTLVVTLGAVEATGSLDGQVD